MQHDFFNPKIHTGTKSSLLGTTAESSQNKSQSRVESLVIGANSIQLRSKILESGGGPSFQSALSLRNQKQDAMIVANNMISPRRNNRQSIEATKLEPIEERQKRGDGGGANHHHAGGGYHAVQHDKQTTSDGVIIQKDVVEMSGSKVPQNLEPLLV